MRLNDFKFLSSQSQKTILKIFIATSVMLDFEHAFIPIAIPAKNRVIHESGL